MVLNILPSWQKPEPHLPSLPPSVLKRILLLASNHTPSTDPEVRACYCLPHSPSAVPYRSGPTSITTDLLTFSTVRRSMESCHLDRGLTSGRGLGPWCCTQYLVYKLGEKRTLPGIAMTSRMFFKLYRNMFIWVFCSEQCLAVAIRRASLSAKRMFTRVRFFEDESGWGQRDYEFCEDVGRSREACEYVGENGTEEIVYAVRKLKRMVYCGVEVRVKKMQVEKKYKPVLRDYDEEEEEEQEQEEEESRGRTRNRGKGKSKEVRFANDRDEEDGKGKCRDWQDENTWTEWKQGSHGMDTDWENWTPDNCNPASWGDEMDTDIPDLEAIGPDTRITQEDWEFREALARSVEESELRQSKNQESGMTAQEEEERDLRRALDLSMQESTKRKSESPVEEEREAKKRKEGGDDEMVTGFRKNCSDLW